MTTPEVLIFVPLDEEMRYVFKTVTARGGSFRLEEYSDLLLSYHCTWELRSRRRIELTFRVLKDMGNIRTAAVVMAAVAQFKPDYTFLVGLAGSLNPDRVKLGDVVVGNMAKLYYPDKIKAIDPNRETLWAGVDGGDGKIKVDPRDTFLEGSYLRYRRDAVLWEYSSRALNDYVSYLRDTRVPDLKPIDPNTVDGLPAAQRNSKPKVVYSAIFGSDMVIDSQHFIAYLQDKNHDEALDYYFQTRGQKHDRKRWFISDLDVVDMESYGFFKALEASKDFLKSSHGFTVRGISDLAAGKEELDSQTADGVRRVAVSNALAVTLDMLEYLFTT